MFYHGTGDHVLRGAALPHRLLVPGRGLARGRPRGAGRGAGALRAGRHGPPGSLRRGALHGRSQGGGPACRRGHGGGAARCCRRRPARHRGPAASIIEEPFQWRHAGVRRPGAARRPPRPGQESRPGRPFPGSVRRAIASRAGKTCGASVPGSWGRTSRCWQRTRPATRTSAAWPATPTWPAARACLASATRCWPSMASGLIVLTGCRHGELSRRLLAGDREGAVATLQRLAALVGPGDRLYVELQHHLLPGRRLAGGGAGAPGPRGRPAHGRDERRPLRPALGPRAAGRARRHPSRPGPRRQRPPAPTERRVRPQERARSWRPCRRGRGRRPARAGRLAGGHRAGRPGRGPLPGLAWSSSATASRASRCPVERRPSRTSRGSATTACGSATTP